MLQTPFTEFCVISSRHHILLSYHKVSFPAGSPATTVVSTQVLLTGDAINIVSSLLTGSIQYVQLNTIHFAVRLIKITPYSQKHDRVLSFSVSTLWPQPNAATLHHTSKRDTNLLYNIYINSLIYNKLQHYKDSRGTCAVAYREGRFGGVKSHPPPEIPKAPPKSCQIVKTVKNC